MVWTASRNDSLPTQSPKCFSFESLKARIGNGEGSKIECDVIDAGRSTDCLDCGGNSSYLLAEQKHQELLGQPCLSDESAFDEADYVGSSS